jgi:hypothetical protein
LGYYFVEIILAGFVCEIGVWSERISKRGGRGRKIEKAENEHRKNGKAKKPKGIE